MTIRRAAQFVKYDIYCAAVPSLGRYELLRPLARGGMADVYLARRRVAGIEKRLVIKRLRRDHQRDPRFLDMFVREAQLSMSLVQQNIVPVFDFGRIGDDVFLAMEHIDGKDLGSSLAKLRGSGLPPMLAAFIAAECCQALDHAHRRKEPVIHRDVTPRNVLLSWDGEVKLADFGIAAVVGEAAGTTFGTPGYMAPEQANNGSVDARGDVYALGIVLWESLTGDHVRPTGERGAALAVARTGELPPIPEAVPAPLAAVIRRATAVSPDARYPSAREMADELDVFIVAERAREGGQTPAKRLAEWLIGRWGDDRTDAADAEMPMDAAAVVSFLEGAARAGGHTERSVAETAADEPAGDAPPPPPSLAGRAPTAEPISMRAPTASPDAPAAAQPRRWPLVVLALLALSIAAYTLGTRNRGVPARADAPVADAAAVTADAPPPPPDAAAPPPIDAPAPVPPPIDAPARLPVARPDAAPPVVTAALRPIWINALPWAYFTVDDLPKQHETPAMLELPIGSHRITFTNPQLGVSRTVTVTVPASGEARHVEKMN